MPKEFYRILNSDTSEFIIKYYIMQYEDRRANLETHENQIAYFSTICPTVFHYLDEVSPVRPDTFPNPSTLHI